MALRGVRRNGKKKNDQGFFLLEALIAVSLAIFVVTTVLYSSAQFISAYTTRVYDEELMMDADFIENLIIHRLRHMKLENVKDDSMAYVNYKGTHNGMKVSNRKLVKILSNGTYQTVTTDKVAILSSPTPYFKVRQDHVLVHLVVQHKKSKRSQTIDIDMVPRNGVPV